MSAGTQASAPTTDPDPRRAAETVPAAIGRVLSLVRKLMDYGRQLAATVQQRAASPSFALFARPFGTADLAVILARITGGLRRAAALEAELCRRAARGQDLTVAPIRLPVPRPPGAGRLTAPPDPPHADTTEEPRLARLPTEEEIAAEVRRRPLGAVIVDICSDLGIAPGHLDRAFWDEIQLAIMSYGGSLTRFVTTLHERLRTCVTADPHRPCGAQMACGTATIAGARYRPTLTLTWPVRSAVTAPAGAAPPRGSAACGRCRNTFRRRRRTWWAIRTRHDRSAPG